MTRRWGGSPEARGSARTRRNADEGACPTIVNRAEPVAQAAALFAGDLRLFFMLVERPQVPAKITRGPALPSSGSSRLRDVAGW